MNAAWWGREAGPRRTPRLAEDGLRPQLLPPTRKAVADALRARIGTYASEWTRRGPEDAGTALVRLYSEQMEPVLARLNRVPDKAKVDFLDLADISPLPATPAKVLLEFDVDEGAPQSVLIAEGFQVSARSNGELVVFETEGTLYGAPAKIVEMHVLTGGTARAIDGDGFYPFGEKGSGTLLLGLSGAAVPGPKLSLGVQIVAPPGAPPPVSSGGVAPLPVPPAPLLEWEVLDGGRPEPAEVVLDETHGLTQSGIVELNIPQRWSPYRAVPGDKPLRWLRLRIVHGAYQEPPRLVFIRLNVVRAVAARTIRDEVLQEIPGSDGRRWALSQKPVVPHSLILEIDEGGPDEAPTLATWREVSSLADAGPDDKVYVLDTGTATVSFGEGRHGEAPPHGFRHIRAARYQAGGGMAGAVDVEAVSNLVHFAAFLNGVSNPLPASGGQSQEPQAEAVERGPQELRARGRAVTTADYALLARRAPGGQVARAHAVAGLHPSFPGRALPGVVGVFVVPTHAKEGPPLPDQQTLSSVASYLAAEVGPAGIDIVAAAPRYHRVRVEARIVIDARASAGETVWRMLKALEQYLHPLTGGEDGKGWPFGGALIYANLMRRASRVQGVHAVGNLNLVVDGVRVPACRDYAISPHGLIWPEGHEIVVAGKEEP